jgi:ribosomal protein S25
MDVDRLAGDLIGNPYVTGQEVARRYGIAGQGAHNALKTLADLGILELGGTRSSGAHIYVAPRVVEVVSA